jgi:hypothetical protein
VGYYKIDLTSDFQEPTKTETAAWNPVLIKNLNRNLCIFKVEFFHAQSNELVIGSNCYIANPNLKNHFAENLLIHLEIEDWDYPQMLKVVKAVEVDRHTNFDFCLTFDSIHLLNRFPEEERFDVDYAETIKNNE